MHLPDSSGKTVLHIAVEEDHEQTLELLLSRSEAKDLVDAVDKENKTALHYAAMGGNKKVGGVPYVMLSYFFHTNSLQLRPVSALKKFYVLRNEPKRILCHIKTNLT